MSINKKDIVKLESIPVIYVKAQNGPKGARQAFLKLESKLESLRNRKFYGAFYVEKNKYHACMAINDEHDKLLGFELDTIPGGMYTRKKIKNWMGKEKTIAPTFEKMAQSYIVDSNRPHIEFYRSQKELILFLPIR